METFVMTLSVVISLGFAIALQTTLIKAHMYKHVLVLAVLGLLSFVVLVFNNPLLLLAFTTLGFFEWYMITCFQVIAYLWIPVVSVVAWKALYKAIQGRTFFGFIHIV